MDWTYLILLEHLGLLERLHGVDFSAIILLDQPDLQAYPTGMIRNRSNRRQVSEPAVARPEWSAYVFGLPLRTLPFR